MRIERLTAETAAQHLPALIDILRDSVDGGASVGFIPPLATAEAETFWTDVIEALRSAHRILLVAVVEKGNDENDGDQIVGTIQLDYARKPNATHRAEVIKLLVLNSARRRGIGRALMEEAARIAKADGRTLLHLDTKSGDPAERLYATLGYSRTGEIPGYVFDEAGTYHPTMIMYKHLV
jgi:acetyltransferase